MQSNNPILNRVETHADYSQPMTVQGAIQKSVLLTVIAAVVGMALFLYCFMTLNISLAYAATLVGAIGGLILGLIATFKPNTARTLAIPYALFEGAFLGGVSVIFQLKYPGVPLQALLATFVTTLVMFGLYRFQIREFGLWHLDADKVQRGFPEIENLLGYCQFRNCTHKHEKQCALRLAAANGEILTRRLDSYLRLIDEIAEAQQKN
jgi:hypothetical protein